MKDKIQIDHANLVLKGWRVVNRVDYKTLTKEEIKDRLRQAREATHIKVNLSRSLEGLKGEWRLLINTLSFMGEAINWHRLTYIEAYDRYERKRPAIIGEGYLPALDQLEEVGGYFYLRQLKEYIEENHLGYGSLIGIMEPSTLRWHLKWFMKKGSRPIKLNQSRAALERELIILIGEVSESISK